MDIQFDTEGLQKRRQTCLFRPRNSYQHWQISKHTKVDRE